MSTTPTTIRLDDDLRKELNSRLDAAGISLNTYVTMAAKQFVIQNRIPFEVIVPEKDQPTAKTKRAMVLAEAKELGLIPDDSTTFTEVNKMMASLDSEDTNV
ncbi:type II toxin-antitoxin system RelB/DinJ family antitoxin [Lactiplantibacillus sp. WILCCON 0030]|uniref:Type II toxin-antitoxin system RelB/DinJ family antitoxin n=1 Tax=Lactiplantibacillus brownii TaxID=3069269 RepID=A0ABU1AAZ9_9LACO|nr:type II toxin-antitoxin system RelB/DinJ family antitoxin [Lactiplantibacillus brownii]MDQ7938144.1 type II toxin-antitoxin system RelB/DinJ family antitoxin [Lactiplantibacillus brownii]